MMNLFNIHWIYAWQLSKYVPEPCIIDSFHPKPTTVKAFINLFSRRQKRTPRQNTPIWKKICQIGKAARASGFRLSRASGFRPPTEAQDTSQPQGFRIFIPVKKQILRAVIEMSFIIFLFYANLFMGEYEKSGMGLKRGYWWALQDIFTASNFVIALLSSFIGYIVFEFLRRKKG